MKKKLIPVYVCVTHNVAILAKDYRDEGKWDEDLYFAVSKDEYLKGGKYTFEKRPCLGDECE